jgi:hypothetical protein
VAALHVDCTSGRVDGAVGDVATCSDNDRNYQEQTKSGFHDLLHLPIPRYPAGARWFRVSAFAIPPADATSADASAARLQLRLAEQATQGRRGGRLGRQFSICVSHAKMVCSDRMSDFHGPLRQRCPAFRVSAHRMRHNAAERPANVVGIAHVCSDRSGCQQREWRTVEKA